ncbi:hypothetical protein GW17_00054669 [Ensete ventricosum]|nr:hypothetical protein GW17_00054669 [Ensete ventricosum]
MAWMSSNASLGVRLPANLDEETSALFGWLFETNRAVRYIDFCHFAISQGKRAIELLSGKEGVISRMAEPTPEKQYNLMFTVNAHRLLRSVPQQEERRSERRRSFCGPMVESEPVMEEAKEWGISGTSIAVKSSWAALVCLVVVIVVGSYAVSGSQERSIRSRLNHSLVLFDFKLFYDVRFGRKRSSKGEAEEDASSGSRHGGIRANGMVTANGSVKRSSDLAVYEQFERQVGGSHPRFSSCVRFDLLSCSAAFIGPAVSAFDLTFYFFLLLMSVGAEDRATGWSYFRQGCKAVLTQMQSGTDIDAERRSTSTLVPTQFSSGVYANVEYRHLRPLPRKKL